jgi:hypothetical protein
VSEHHKIAENKLVATSKAAGDPSAEQLALINQFTLREYTAEEVYARSFYVAHNAIDRDGEVFDDALLEDFAKTLPGKGVFVKHPRTDLLGGGPGVGTWFAARVLRMPLDEARSALKEPDLRFAPGTTEALVLEASAYMPRAEHRLALIEDIDAGAAKFVSIGFTSPKDMTPIRDENDNIIAWRLHGPAEAVETSFVWLGAQPGAASHKSSKRHQIEDDDMTDKQLKEQVDTLTKQLEDAKQKATFYDRLEGLLGKETLEGEDAPERLGKAIKDGKDAHAAAVDRVVSLERTLGMVEGDDDKDVAAAKEVYRDFPMARLQALEKRYGEIAEKGGQGGQGASAAQGQLGGADPNAAGGQGGKDGGGKKGLRDASATKTALGEQQAA